MNDTSVLIVDDEPGVTAALMVRLQQAGYTVYHAINGLAGVEAAAIHTPDAIVMDIRMPDIDGIDTCRRVKRIPGLEHTPVIFLSASCHEDDRICARDAGAAAFLSKPFESSEVISTLQQVTQCHATKEPLHAQSPPNHSGH